MLKRRCQSLVFVVPHQIEKRGMRGSDGEVGAQRKVIRDDQLHVCRQRRESRLGGLDARGAPVVTGRIGIGREQIFVGRSHAGRRRPRDRVRRASRSPAGTNNRTAGTSARSRGSGRRRAISRTDLPASARRSCCRARPAARSARRRASRMRRVRGVQRSWLPGVQIKLREARLQRPQHEVEVRRRFAGVAGDDQPVVRDTPAAPATARRFSS